MDPVPEHCIGGSVSAFTCDKIEAEGLGDRRPDRELVNLLWCCVGQRAGSSRTPTWIPGGQRHLWSRSKLFLT